MPTASVRNINAPDETRTFPNGKLDVVTLSGVMFDRHVLEPGWKWSECNKPLRKTESCQGPHTCYMVAGRLHVVMDDGTETEIGPGDVAVIAPGHDAWVVGNEPCIFIGFRGHPNYGTS
jgi:hypothetical protein